MGQGPGRAADLTLVREEQRAAEMRRCAQIAYSTLLDHAPTRSIAVEDGRGGLVLDPALRPGMTVRIWATKNAARGFVSWVQQTSSREKSYRAHLAAEIVPFAPKRGAPTFSVGFAFDDNALKVGEETVWHNFSPEESTVMTPDDVLLMKVADHRMRPRVGFVELVALGVLTRKHLAQLASLLEGASSTTRLVDLPPIDPHNEIPVRYLETRKMPVYRALSFACTRSSTQNCTSFVTTLFPDVLTCRNLLGLAMPNACHNEAVNNEDFGGCSDEDGTLYPTAARQLKAVASEMRATEAMLQKRYATLLASRSVQRSIAKRSSTGPPARRQNASKLRP